MNFGADVLGKTVQFPKGRLNKSSMFISPSFYFQLFILQGINSFPASSFQEMIITGKQKILGWKSGEISGGGVTDLDSKTWPLVNFLHWPSLHCGIRKKASSRQQLGASRLDQWGLRNDVGGCSGIVCIGILFHEYLAGSDDSANVHYRLSKCCQIGPRSLASGLKVFFVVVVFQKV